MPPKIILQTCDLIDWNSQTHDRHITWFCMCVYVYRWVSGVGSAQHPVVWTACVAYTHSTALRDRVWGQDKPRSFLCLVYCQGCTQPSFWQCRVGVGGDGETEQEREQEEEEASFAISTGEATIQV